MTKSQITDCHRVLRITLIGPPPPPPGGVATSIANIQKALTDRSDVKVTVMNWQQMWRLPFRRPDILHFNFTLSKKRLIGTLIGRLCGSRVVHTVHGNNFDFSKFGNKWAVRLSHGIILLNQGIYRKFERYGKTNIKLLTPILALEQTLEHNDLDPRLVKTIEDTPSSHLALVYANGRQYIDGDEVYGFHFIGGLLPKLKERGYRVLFLDPSASYTKTELDPFGTGALIHYCQHVDFVSLLRRTDVYFRPTSTDGNSVAVMEALQEGVPVVASDAVLRPMGVRKYAYLNEDGFLEQIDHLGFDSATSSTCLLSAPEEYMEFMKCLDYE